jgi:sugar O-acyltransferase (sialic acid O-acetyltransferase NeuD family)
MKQLVIIGAGGFGIELYSLAKDCIGYNESFIIKGFIDDDLSKLNSNPNLPKILNTIDLYQIDINDIFICSFGDILLKKEITNKIKTKGGNFFNLIHKSSIVLTDITRNEGVIVGPFVTIGSNCTLGNHILYQTGTIVGHDAYVGDWTRLDSYVVIVGGVFIKSSVKIHTSSVINHNVTIEDNACVGALSFVIRNVKENTTVFGNPAKILT